MTYDEYIQELYIATDFEIREDIINIIFISTKHLSKLSNMQINMYTNQEEFMNSITQKKYCFDMLEHGKRIDKFNSLKIIIGDDATIAEENDSYTVSFNRNRLNVMTREVENHYYSNNNLYVADIPEYVYTELMIYCPKSVNAMNVII